MTRHVLLPLFDDVVVLEPVDKFVREAMRSARKGEWTDLPKLSKGEESRKRVWFVRGGLQSCEPRFPGDGGETLGIVGEPLDGEGFGEEIMYDV